VYIVVSVYFRYDSVRKLLDTPYVSIPCRILERGKYLHFS